MVARLRPNGALDPDFDADGRVTLPGRRQGHRGAGAPDSGSSSRGTAAVSATMMVTRLLPNGSLDPASDGDGTATIDFGVDVEDIAAGVVLQPDGKIVVAGYTQADEDVAVARLNPDGSLDAEVRTAGKATVDFGVATFGNAVALAPNGRIVVAGQRTGADDFAVARLLG